MIDLALLRQSPDVFKHSQSLRGQDPEVIDEILQLDQDWRKTSQELEAKRAEANSLSKTRELAEQNMVKLKSLKEEISDHEKEAVSQEKKLKSQVALVSNLLRDDVPEGRDSADNKVLGTWGEITHKTGKSHEDLLTALDWLDLETASAFSGTRFRYLKNEAAIAEQKLLQLALNLAIERGFTPVVPPVVAMDETLQSAGFFPKGQEDTFQLNDRQYLIGTSEPMLLALAANHKYKAEDLPVRFVGISTCFRQEAGSYGKDVKGMFRMHQFDKVEMVSIVAPEKSEEEHQFLLSVQEEVVQKLGIPYQKVFLCSGDQTHVAAKQIDIESWFPSQERFRETHSSSNCTDFQSRDMKIKVENQEDNLVLAHTLNATLVTERLLLAAVENNQQPDGTVNLPAELTR